MEKKDSVIDNLNSEQQEVLKASFDKLNESDNLCREWVTKNSKLKVDNIRLRINCVHTRNEYQAVTNVMDNFKLQPRRQQNYQQQAVIGNPNHSNISK